MSEDSDGKLPVLGLTKAAAGDAEVRLRHALDPRVRRWCACEFFCSAIDRPWLMRNELRGYLAHVGISKGTKLARPELAIIRASLGRPRRLSLSYLRLVGYFTRTLINEIKAIVK